MAHPSSKILARRDGALGHLTLNRPQAINALDRDMIDSIGETLSRWSTDSDLAVVVLDGAGERGLCAGGDVRAAHDFITGGDPDQALAYFRAEYQVDAALAEFAAPVVSIMDGVTMGGGIGLAAHASVRIVTERSTVAMPETRIGFTPDVGGSLLLARAPGHLGEFLAASAATMGPGEAITAGFADVMVPSSQLDALRAALAAQPGDPSGVVAAFAVTPPAAGLDRERIDQWFAASTARDIVTALRQAAADGDPQAERWLTAIEMMSPTAVEIAIASVRAARQLPDADAPTSRPALRAALAREYALVCWFCEYCPDMVEGIRAQLVDKDRSPRWNPRTLAQVDPAVIAEALAYRPAIALW